MRLAAESHAPVSFIVARLVDGRPAAWSAGLGWGLPGLVGRCCDLDGVEEVGAVGGRHSWCVFAPGDEVAGCQVVQGVLEVSAA
jgi:hypothetical protein